MKEIKLTYQKTYQEQQYEPSSYTESITIDVSGMSEQQIAELKQKEYHALRVSVFAQHMNHRPVRSRFTQMKDRILQTMGIDLEAYN